MRDNFMDNFVIEKMSMNTVQGASDVEYRCFTDPWSTNLLKKELDNDMAHYFVILDDNKVVAYCGYWDIVDDAQIMNVAVDPSYRGKGLSNRLLDTMIESAKKDNMLTMSLEVRVSNKVAISLYEKYGFVTEGRRKGYYADNGEDAYIMYKYFK